MTDDDLVKAAETILARINDDNSRHGGLITRETIRACDEARLVIDRWRHQGYRFKLGDVVRRPGEAEQHIVVGRWKAFDMTFYWINWRPGLGFDTVAEEALELVT